MRGSPIPGLLSFRPTTNERKLRWMGVPVYVFAFVCVYPCVCVPVCVHVHMCAYMCICVCVYAYRRVCVRAQAPAGVCVWPQCLPCSFLAGRQGGSEGTSPFQGWAYRKDKVFWTHSQPPRGSYRLTCLHSLIRVHTSAWDSGSKGILPSASLSFVGDVVFH